MKQLCTFFCIILSTYFASAQDRYLPGNIILTSNESKDVEIYYEDWSASPQQIKVRENGVIIAYKPEQLKGFEIPSLEKSYISEKLTLNFTAQIPITSYSELFTETKTESFFLKKLVTSNILSLYVLIDHEERTRFFIRKDTDLIELIKYSFVMSEKGILNKKENNDYKNQLANMFADELDILKPMPSYEQASLIKFVKKYNESKGETTNNYINNVTDESYVKFGINTGFESVEATKYDFSNKKINFGLSGMYLLPHKHNNRFLVIDYYSTTNYPTKIYSSNEESRKNTFSAFVGKFIGNKPLQGYFSVGLTYSSQVVNTTYGNYGSQKLKILSTNIGPNIGIAYKKQFVLELSKTVLFLGGSGIISDPQIHFKYFPVQKKLRQ
ncbi:hypothetical protein [Lacihabitans lacunae]|uniref:Uncharacterized protein n=1 Tax=Lacihabitans lacunae TaxID=1028214 RepID=A0ABV7YZ55_9BACT